MSDQTLTHQQLMDRVRQQTAFGQQQPQTSAGQVAADQNLGDQTHGQPNNQPSDSQSNKQPSNQPTSDLSNSGSQSSLTNGLTNLQKIEAMETALDQTRDRNSDQTPTPSQAGGNRQKEQFEGSGLATQELIGEMRAVESEPSVEISPELESFLKQAEKPDQKQVEQQLKELAEQTAQETAASPQAMKVLPLTKEQSELGQKKSPKFSIRWLVEFSEKISKIFVGRAVYRQEKN